MIIRREKQHSVLLKPFKEIWGESIFLEKPKKKKKKEEWIPSSINLRGSFLLVSLPKVKWKH